MEYKYIDPEVSGGLGSESVLDNSVHPPIIKELHYEFDGWLGDDIIESFPAYLITERLKQEIENNSFTGYLISNVLITKSSLFNEIYPNKNLPEFHWLKVYGKAGVDDFGIGKGSRLVISKRVITTLTQFTTLSADFEEFSNLKTN
jgi:hypothetical protein